MKEVSTATRQVEVSGVEEIGAFSIAVNDKAFRVLISSLYSDKPRAIIRELWSNAYDSHVMAGIMNRPFYCHLPTVWEPEFSVRDYGVSLTHEQVMKLYTTVFQSTKEDTNTQIGKFGLGSKTPFAYTDSYTITARLDGEKRIYNAFIDEKGIPRIALFHTEASDEEQGLEVSFPVQGKDMSAFKQAAERVIMGFEVPPENNLKLAPPVMAVRLQGDDWRLYEREWNGLQGAHVRQGCVLYPVDYTAVAGVRNSEAVKALVSESIVIDMPIGSVDITPSRESLSYDETTCNNIIAKFEEIVQGFVRGASDQIKSANTLWGAVTKRAKITSHIHNRELLTLIVNGLTWRGRRVPEEIYLARHQIKRLAKAGVNIKATTKRWRSRTKFPSLDDVEYINQDIYSVNQNFYYWTGDTPKHLGWRLKSLRDQFTTCYVIPDFDPNSYGAKMLMAMWGRNPNLKFIDLTTIPFEKPDPKKSIPNLKVWKNSRFEELANADLPEDKEIFYVNIHGSEQSVKFCGDHIVKEVFDGVWRALITHQKIDHTKIILLGIPSSRKDLSKKLPEEWESFEEKILDILGEFDIGDYNASLAWGVIDYGTRCVIRSLRSLFASIRTAVTPDSPFGILCLKMDEFLNKAERGELWKPLRVLIDSLPKWMKEAFCRELSAPVDHRGVDELCRSVTRIRKIYPLLNVESKPKPNLEYINLIDQRDAEKRMCDLAWDAL